MEYSLHNIDMSFDSSDLDTLDTLDTLDEGSLSPFVDASDIDPDVNLYLDKLFTEKKRSGAFIIHGVVTRVRQDESILQDVWDKMAVTFCNIGASDGERGRGVLFKRTSMTYDTETTFLKILRFEDIAMYTILKYMLSTREISVNEWHKVHKRIPPRGAETDTGDDNRKTYRFDGVDGVKLSLVGTSKLVADRFHDSMAECNMVKSPLRGHGGLNMFDFPGEDIVGAARKRLFFLLDAKHRLAFCIQQIFGEADFDLYAFSHGITCASPNDVAYEQKLSSCPLGGMDESVVGALESANPPPTLIAGGEESVENDQISTEPPLKKRCSEASRSREGSRAEDYLKEQAEKAKDEAKAAKQEAQLLREQLAALKVARETPQAAPQEKADIGIKIEEDSDDDSIDSEEREKIFREIDEERERQERLRDQQEIEQFGMDGHEQRKRRRLSKYDATHVFTFLEFRNAYRTMREKRNIEIEFIVWLKVFMLSAYFAATEYGALYVHEHEIIPSLDDPRRMQGNSFLIYIGIFICAGVMLLFFAFNEPTACDWFYGLAIMPATRLCFDSNQGHASMIIIVLLCSQKIKWLLALEFVGVVVFVVIAPLANRFIFIGRLLLTMVFYQNRLVNHLDQRTPTIFLSVWRELILTLMFVVHFVIDKVQL